jgi:DNA-directed RNA polymerase specialized sigma24 family protein
MMNEPSVREVEQKKNWTLTPRAFNRLLNWLDDGTNSEGEKYLEMRRRLIAYFDRKNCCPPDDLADETLSRVARRIDEEDFIESETPARYCYIVARFVFMENLRSTERNDEMLDEMRRQAGRGDHAAEAYEKREKRLSCLDRCTGKLEPSNCALIISYYFGNGRVKIGNRRALADSLGITMNALSIRACRIRDKLEVCVRQCAAMESE